MQVVTELNQSLVENVPLYGQALNYAQLQYNQSLESLNKIIAASFDRVTKARKASNSIASQATTLLSQSADELL
jgi:predicted PurR-regulated permease PerM